MAARKAAPTFSESYYAVSREKLSQLGDSLAQQAGAPASIKVRPLTDRLRVRAWNQAHPAATYEARLGLAVQKYAEHRQRGLPDEDARRATAEDVTHFQFRARQTLYSQGTTKWDEQVKEATRLSRLSAGRSESPEGLPDVLPRRGQKAPETPGNAAANTENPELNPRPVASPSARAEEGMTDEY